MACVPDDIVQVPARVWLLNVQAKLLMVTRCLQAVASSHSLLLPRPSLPV